VFGIALDRASRRSLALQLADGLRRAVTSGELGTGTRLPPSRELAAELGISRRLVTDAYEQLTGEGWFETRAGHGTYAAALPARKPHAALLARDAPRPRRGTVRFDFTPGIPDLSAFPRQAWRRASDESLSLARPAELSYGPAMGDLRLREAISAYLHRFRGLSAAPERICVTSGTSHSLSLLSRLLPATTLFCEDPGLGFARYAFASAGHRCRPVHVDDAGALPGGLGEIPRGALFYLTPSHQFPTGALLPLRRRLEFLELAADARGLVLEDDYDSEFRFRGSPVPPLFSLDEERVAYLGTFSKCLAPFVRTGYLIAPAHLTGPLAELVRRTNLRGSIPHQRTLARFLEEGRLERHVFSAKRRYRARLEAVLSFLEERWGGEARASGAETGFHLYVRFASRRFGARFLEACDAEGLRVSTGADFLAEPPPESDALVIGYGNVADAKLGEGLASLASLVERYGTP
jgi:GntR family transcriptional regulator/MocR family aminotransferase